MMHGSGDVKHDRQFSVTLGNFLHFYLAENQKNQNFEKMKKNKTKKKHQEISSFYTIVPKIMIRCYTVPEI